MAPEDHVLWHSDCTIVPWRTVRGEQVLSLNEEALAQLGAAVSCLVIIPGTSHLFEEPGALEEFARLAADWFTRLPTG